MSKKKFKSVKIFILKWLAWILTRILISTYKFEYLNQNVLDEAIKSGCILCLWHEHQLAFAASFYGKKQNIYPLVSKSKDGDIFSFLINKIGYKTIRGSSSRGGKEAAIELKALLKQSNSICITPDGPRGPRHKVSSGAIHLAKETGTAILPSVALANKNWVMSSWDQFKLPKPFSKIKVVFGIPMYVEPSAVGDEFEGYKSKLSSALHELENKLKNTTNG